MIGLGAEEARARLPELLDNAFFRDETTIIKKRGVPYAKLVPLVHVVQPEPVQPEHPPSMVQEPVAIYAIAEDIPMPTNDLLERAAQLTRELAALLQPKPRVNKKRAIDIARDCNLIGLGEGDVGLSSNYKAVFGASLAEKYAEQYPAT